MTPLTKLFETENINVNQCLLVANKKNSLRLSTSTGNKILKTLRLCTSAIYKILNPFAFWDNILLSRKDAKSPRKANFLLNSLRLCASARYNLLKSDNSILLTFLVKKNRLRFNNFKSLRLGVFAGNKTLNTQRPSISAIYKILNPFAFWDNILLSCQDDKSPRKVSFLLNSLRLCASARDNLSTFYNSTCLGINNLLEFNHFYSLRLRAFGGNRYTFVELIVTLTVGVVLTLLMTNAFTGDTVVASVAPLEKLSHQSAVRDVMEFADALWGEQAFGSFDDFNSKLTDFADKKRQTLKVVLSEISFSLQEGQLTEQNGGAAPAYKLVVSCTPSFEEETFTLTRIFFR